MKIKIYLITILLFASSNSGFSQNLSFDDLLTIQKKTIVEINSYLINKGWSFESSTSDDNLEDKTIGWSLQKNKETNKARGWLKLYSRNGFENIISYQTIKRNYINIQAKCKSSNFIADDVSVKDDKMEIGYKKGSLKCAFSSAKNEEIADEDDETDIFYTIEIYNFVEIQNYLDVIKKSEEVEASKQLIKDEKIKKEQIVLKEYSDLIDKADKQFANKNFQEAKLTYSNAQNIFPNENYPKEKIEEIKIIENFDNERTNKSYRYTDIDNVQFKNIVQKIESELLQISALQSEAKINGFLILKFDINGNKNIEFKNSTSQVLPIQISKKIINLEVDKPTKFELKVATCDTINYNINYNTKIMSIKKTENDVNINESVNDLTKSQIRSFLQGKPIGKYKLSIKSIEVNNSDDILVDQVKFSKPHSSNVTLYSITGAIAGSGYLIYYLIKDMF
jgi:hypothetical protein